jgi:hypothetical protein
MDLVQERPYFIASGRLQLSKAALDSLRWRFGFQFADQINGVNEPIPVSSPHTRTHNSMFVPSQETFIMLAAPRLPTGRVLVSLFVTLTDCADQRALNCRNTFRDKPRRKWFQLFVTYDYFDFPMNKRVVVRRGFSGSLPDRFSASAGSYICTAEQYS